MKFARKMCTCTRTVQFLNGIKLAILCSYIYVPINDTLLLFLILLMKLLLCSAHTQEGMLFVSSPVYFYPTVSNKTFFLPPMCMMRPTKEWLWLCHNGLTDKTKTNKQTHQGKNNMIHHLILHITTTTPFKTELWQVKVNVIPTTWDTTRNLFKNSNKLCNYTACNK